MATISVLEGYVKPNFGRKSENKMSAKAKFKKAARACKGKKIHAFRACMRKKLKKSRRSRR